MNLHSFSKKEFLVLGGAVLLLIPALLLNLQLVPLYGEEPRRAVVAMEMLFRHNWIVPTVNGEIYQLKPPFFNWILASLYTLTGSNSEFITRIPTVVSLLLLGSIIYYSGKVHVSKTFGALSAILFIVAAGNLFFNSLLAEIDLFYSLVTYASLVCLFHFHSRRQYYLLFLTVYFLGAIGILTKGAPSLVYTGLSILVFFIVNREFKKLFSLAHFASIFLFLLLVGAYFFAYQQQGDSIFYFQNLSNESGKRFSGYTIWDYFSQLMIYPFDTLKDLLPGSLLLFFAFRKSFLQVIRSNPLIKFAFLMLIVHFPIYWLPPGSRQRYIIMLYPFILQIAAYFYLNFVSSETRKARLLNLSLIIITGLLALATPVPLFLEKLCFIKGLPWITVLSLIAIGTIFFFQVKFPKSALVGAILAIVILRIVFDLLVLPVRSQEGKAYSNKKTALELVHEAGNKPVCVFRTSYFPMQCTYYMERDRQEIIPICQNVQSGSYHIVQIGLLERYRSRREIGVMMDNPLKPESDPFSSDNEDIFSGYDYQVLHEFYLQKARYLLLMPV
jgi:4-amino-4-deoxy-L-arabinose transferase-like glycosyltransferase